VSGEYSGVNMYKVIKAVLGKKEMSAVLGEKGSLVFK
jgi:hypothetical protein